jgi:hypothetical protein
MRGTGELGEDIELTVERGQRRFASGDRIMFLRNDRGLGVKNGTLGTIEAVSARDMVVRTDDGHRIAVDLRDYDRIDHGYAATIHKAQGMTVDRTHVLATPGLDAHGIYVACSRHRVHLDLHYGRDDFATRERLIRTLSRDRAKDMALDYANGEPVQAYARRRGITILDRVAEIVRKDVLGKMRELIDGPRSSGGAAPGPEVPHRPGREAIGRQARRGQTKIVSEMTEDRETALRRARTKALKRHARALATVFDAQITGGKASSGQVRDLNRARDAFEELRPHGWRDAEAAYVKDPEIAREAGAGRVNRAIRALQLETELRTGPQLESLLANRKADLGIYVETGRQLGPALAFTHGLDLGRGRGLGL